MVTDLLRNDVARISEPGHLVVKKFAAVETFAHVHQLVTTIQSRVKADLTFTEFMTAMFPGGSITGTPKKRPSGHCQPGKTTTWYLYGNAGVVKSSAGFGYEHCDSNSRF